MTRVEEKSEQLWQNFRKKVVNWRKNIERMMKNPDAMILSNFFSNIVVQYILQIVQQSTNYLSILIHIVCNIMQEIIDIIG